MNAERVFKPVEDRSLSPILVPARNPATMRSDTVVPDIHTPYDFYERIYLDA
jgi:hypothetical protein